MTPTPSLIAAGLVILVAVALGILLRPLLAADMRRTVERANDNTPPDLTAIALMLLGGALVAGVPLSAGLLWATWA